MIDEDAKPHGQIIVELAFLLADVERTLEVALPDKKPFGEAPFRNCSECGIHESGGVIEHSDWCSIGPLEKAKADIARAIQLVLRFPTEGQYQPGCGEADCLGYLRCQKPESHGGSI